jgi:hypothetical protein
MRRALALSSRPAPRPAAAHPHVFIDTGSPSSSTTENRLVAIRVAWAYDELYSLLVLEERGLDQDYDGVLTPEELDDAQRLRHAMDRGIRRRHLRRGRRHGSRPRPARGPCHDDGGRPDRHDPHPRVSLLPPADGVSVKAYDPTFYTAYDLPRRDRRGRFGLRHRGRPPISTPPTPCSRNFSTAPQRRMERGQLPRSGRGLRRRGPPDMRLGILIPLGLAPRRRPRLGRAGSTRSPAGPRRASARCRARWPARSARSRAARPARSRPSWRSPSPTASSTPPAPATARC